MIVAKFSTLAGGVWIEEALDENYSDAARCFRFDAQGRAEWARRGDLISGQPAPRWFSHQYTAKDFILC